MEGQPPISSKVHWENVWQTKSPDKMSWYQPHLRLSMDWIEAAVLDRSSEIIDIGGGASTLVVDLLLAGFKNVTVLDISSVALTRSQECLATASSSVHWLTGDVTDVALRPSSLDLWHDRAVFHFLTAARDREAYVKQMHSAVRPGGHIIMATFGLGGPSQCSGLGTAHYSAESLQRELGDDFRLAQSTLTVHETPMRTYQEFLYCHFIFNPA
jgi:SAM-dependent methyltransferase